MDQQQQPLTRHQRRELERQQRKQHADGQQRQGSARRVLVWVSVVVGLAVVVVGLIFLSGRSSPTVAEVAPVTSQDWVRGPGGAKATLIEYSDLQCPACAQYYPILKQLEEAFPDDVRLVYRHYPLKAVHQNAELAAQASEAAGEQGKFWEMHDRLFEQQREWSGATNVRELILGYAKALGLDEAAFTTTLDGQAVKDRVNEDVQSGDRVSVNYTPTFFLNGEKVKNPSGFEPFRALIQEAIDGA